MFIIWPMETSMKDSIMPIIDRVTENTIGRMEINTKESLNRMLSNCIFIQMWPRSTHLCKRIENVWNMGVRHYYGKLEGVEEREEIKRASIKKTLIFLIIVANITLILYL